MPPNDVKKQPLEVVHVFPYDYTVSGGHSNSIHAFMQGEAAGGITSMFYCPATDDPELEQFLRDACVPIRRHASPTHCELIALQTPGLLFHFHGINAISLRLASRLRADAISYVFTSGGTLHFRGTMGFIKKFIYLNVLSRFIRGAGGLHYLTSHERNRGRLLIPGYHGRVLVAPNIVEIPDFRPPPFKRSELGLPEDGFLFLFLGRLHVEHKGLDILMEAFARVARELNARLALVGPDWQGGNEVLRTLARNLGCLDRVHFLEPQYHEAKWRTLAAADAFVSPSRWDAFNIALVEAIGLGRPTITTTSISLAGDLAENEAALLCAANPAALADCMKAIILDPDLRCRMAARGQEWVANQCAPLPVGRLLANFYGEVVGLS